MNMDYRYSSIAALAAMALAVASCSDNENTPDGPRPDVSGKDVNFSLTAPDQSRTWYADASWEDNATEADIYWGIMNESAQNMANEEVIIYGNYAGRNKGHYKVSGYNTGSNTGSNKATTLTVQGNVGVQWGADPGEGSKVRFYSVYPALNAQYMDANGGVDGKLRTAVTPSQDAIGFNLSADQLAPATKPEAARTIIAYPNMNAAVMVATAEADYGQQTVPLEYHMITNTLEISLNGLAESLINGTSQDYIDIFSIKISGKNPIAGEFDYTPTFEKNNDGTPNLSKSTTSVVNGNNNIVIQLAQVVNEGNTQKVVHPRLYYHDENTIDRLKARAFLLPNVNPGDLTIYVETSMGYYQLDGDKLIGSQFTQGLIHKLKLPKFDENGRHDFDYSHWMDQIDPTVYATELSLPGSWESFNTVYQPVPADLGGLENYQYQYMHGIRAFTVKPSGVNQANTDITIQSTNNTTLSSVLRYFRTQLSTNKDEFVVLIVRGLDANSNYIKALRSLCTGDYKDIVYREQITPETTVGDLRGKVVIKGNVDNENTKYTESTPMLYSRWSKGSAGEALETPLYWGTWPGETPAGPGNTGLYWCYTEVEEIWNDDVDPGEWGATKSQRKAAIDSYINQSLTEYKREEHDTWMFLLIGGFDASMDNKNLTVATTSAIAELLNGYTYEKLSDPNRQACPMGLVMMNCVNTNDMSKNLIRTIINNNDAFIMQKKGAAQAENDATFTDGGNLGI